LKILFIYFFIVGFFFSFLLVFSIIFLGVFNYSFCFCFACLWEKGKPILCVLGNAHIDKNCFFQVAHSIKHSNMGCGVHPPHVMTKLKKNENLVGLIWVSKVSYAMGFKDVWDSQNWTRSSSKKECEKRSFDLWITMNWKWFMASKFHHIQFSLQIYIVLQTCVFQTIFIGLCEHSL